MHCSLNNGRGYLYTGEPGGWPGRDYIAQVNDDFGDLAIQGASLSRPLLLTVERARSPLPANPHLVEET